MSVTRERIMELAEELILTKGYNAFSYQDISSELGIKNAAIHYYFPSKANLGTSIVKNNFLRFEEMIENMDIRKFDEVKQLESFLRVYVKSAREQKICVIGSLGPDFNTLPEASQKELQKMTNRIIDWLTKLLETGRYNGVFAFKGDAHNRALLVLSTMIASLQMARVLDKQAFKDIHQSLIDDLIA
ncbi:TetR/AcrR family transcriptional regulator [Sunxiuqinia elliptica]|uniref:Transcriptional regulator, TetR family n=1 Tax=Sunxiuqinia elliptica TaxID=655355 RepID=A0A1I2KHT6_9BACT|nr:TetR/AcrR family transcriptional regulator [Sunxiuqinia elliptica]SFF64506.1 transcriptional regulator, TetR family [Sunxiuqinia elliptica]